jgi:hypothetical protein
MFVKQIFDSKLENKPFYDSRSVGQSVLESSPIWDPRSDYCCHQSVAILSVWGALSDEKTYIYICLIHIYIYLYVYTYLVSECQHITVLYVGILNLKKCKLRGPSRRENYTGRTNMSTNLVPTFADRVCHVVSVTNSYDRILGVIFFSL